jgi:hypothetical protein
MLIILFLSLFKIVLSEFTLGKTNSKLTINLYLNIDDKENVKIIKEVVNALQKSCFKSIEENNVQLILYPLTSKSNGHSKLLLNYLNKLEVISREFSDCFSCNLNKFYRGIRYFYKISEYFSEIISADIADFPYIINKILPEIDSEIIQNVFDDEDMKTIYSRDKFKFKLFFTNAPLIIVNTINIISPEKVDANFWEGMFKNNFGEYKQCDDYENFFNNF